LGAKVTGISLQPATRPNLFSLAGVEGLCDNRFLDIRDSDAVATAVQAANPQIVLHLAAQAMVRAGYREPLATFSINTLGTAHVLDALRRLDGIRVAVMVTTDKVYRNQEHPFPYRETDPLGGHDPYSASKAAAELVIASYRDAYLADQGVAVASARAGNVIGGGDWSEDRLIPDAVRAWQAGEVLAVRRPQAIRPWQHVLEPLTGYLILAESLWKEPKLAGSYNFGPPTHEGATVRTVVELARQSLGGEVCYSDGAEGPHEAHWLALEIAKSRVMLRANPRWTLSAAVNRSMAWYCAQRNGAGARSLCEADISLYETCP
jgi:CDP-glucose 4,6-dehydratase